MKLLSLMLGLCLMTPALVHAQGAAAANPVTTSMREIYDRQSKWIAEAAKEMPADKYSYHPTADQWSFGKIVAHVVQANYGVCAMISDTPAPQGVKVADSDPKDKLTPALDASFDFCASAMGKLQDSKMGDPITFFRGRKTVRARAAIELTDDLEDHYSQMASYLRLNGMQPPSAQPPK